MILPWPHGGEVNWQYFVFSTGIFILATIYFYNNITAPSNTNGHLTLVTWPLVLLGAWLLFQLVQIIPQPIHLSNVSNQSLVSEKWQTISVAPNITLQEILKHTSFVIIFILALCLLDSKKRILAMATALFFSSAIIALYSLINHYSNGAFDLIDSIPPWTIAWKKATHGTFSYQNHYASFLIMTIPLGYGLLYSNIKNNILESKENRHINKVFHLFTPINSVYLLSLTIMLIALFKTASRGGNAAFILSIAVTFLCVLLHQKNTNKQKAKKALLMATGAIAIANIVIFTGLADSLLKRLDTQGYNSNDRVLMIQTTFSIIEKRPLVGTGAGTYPILQQLYKSPDLGISAMSKRAHNDYLELFANQGLIGFSLLSGATLLLLLTLIQGLKRNVSERYSNLYGFQVASFCSIIAILIHSIVDFNFHLPVNAIYFYMILALGIKCQIITNNLNNNQL